ncbi:MAG: sigma-70 family RNA polymerase sigma factor [Chloroflexota bacterium]
MREDHAPTTPQVSTEEGLVREAQQGNSDAFAQLYEEHLDRIYRYMVLRVGNKTEAEDLTEQVFLKALESIGKYRLRGAPFASWLFKIAHNLVVDYFRRASRMQTTSITEAIPSTGKEVWEQIELKLKFDAVTAAIKRLTEAQQQVISLRFAGGLSSAEVATVMGRSEGAVKALQHSALVALKRSLAGSA